MQPQSSLVFYIDKHTCFVKFIIFISILTYVKWAFCLLSISIFIYFNQLRVINQNQLGIDGLFLLSFLGCFIMETFRWDEWTSFLFASKTFVWSELIRSVVLCSVFELVSFKISLVFVSYDCYPSVFQLGNFILTRFFFTICSSNSSKLKKMFCDC